jgi:pimeloyl-ACP methyl ester carboxylesterase
MRILGGMLGIIILLIMGVVFIYVPGRTNRLEKRAADFVREFKPQAEEIDAKFHHQDRTVNGIKWHYVDEGSQNGRVILFMHGLPEGWYSWRYVLPLIDPDYRLIAIDMKGYGRSDKTDNNYDWHVVADQTADFIKSLGIKKCFVVSHDWGSLIASIMVGDHPDLILGFVRMQADLIKQNQMAALIKKPQFILFRSKWFATYMMKDAEEFIDRVYPPRMVTPFKEWDRNYFVYEFYRPGVAKQVPRYFDPDNWDMDGALTKICHGSFPFPVMALQAEKDPPQPVSWFKKIPKECPNIELKWISNASHFSNLDQPEQVAKAINEFVNRVK